MSVTSVVIASLPSTAWPTVCSESATTAIVCGGRNQRGPLADAYRFDATARSWTALPAMNAPRFGHTLVSLGEGEVLALGGWQRSSSATGARSPSVAERWDGERWCDWDIAGLPLLSWHTTTIVGDDLLLIAGGSDEAGCECSGSWLLAFREQRVREHMPMRRSRAHHQAVCVPDSTGVLVVGPNDFNAEFWSLRSGEWQDSGAVLPRSSGTLVATKRSVLFAGGKDPEPMAILQEWTGSGSWARLADLPLPCGGCPATVLGDQRVALSGAGERGDGLLCYDPKSGSWFVAAEGLTARFAHGAISIGDSQLLVVGGLHNDSVELLTIDSQG